MLETIQTLTTITNKEMSIQLDTNMIHRTKPITKMLPCNQVMASTQLCSLKVNQDMIFQRMLRTYLTLIITTNREMFYLLDTSMTHKAKLTLKTMLCNQVIATDIQSCSLKISTTFLWMLEICQTLITITNKEMFFQQVTNTIHRAKLISKIMLCNQVTAIDIQTCLHRKMEKERKARVKEREKTWVKIVRTVETVETKVIVKQNKMKLKVLQSRNLLQFKERKIMMIQQLQLP